ncbi:MAG: hypothetical protein R3321_05550 [Nitrososphaeraceae archaeon]|nr:hypothetical protein [Nitrososphaeraceae archaeon]
MVEEFLPPVSVDEVLKIHESVCNKARELVEKKGRDYNRQRQTVNNDTLFNIKVCKYLCITDSVCQGLLVRLADKLSRLSSLTRNPTVGIAVAGEKVDDTIQDMVNYLVYLKIMYDVENEVIHKRQEVSNIGDQ